jgi:putative toxin-antitoxin system antitoxin component (TIGR02293 family)
MNADNTAALPLGRSKQPAVFKPSRKIRVVLKNGEIRSTNVDLVFRELIRAKGARLDNSSTKQVIVSGQVPAEAVVTLANWLKSTQEEMLKLLGITQTTFGRRKQAGTLRADEADRVYRYTRLYTLATKLFHGDADATRKWLNTPAYAFNGETPLRHAATEHGAHEVETLIGRIEHGIPS